MSVRCLCASVFSISRLSFSAICICVTALLTPVAAQAVDCIPDDITLTSQADIDTFQVDYNSCTNIAGTLRLDSGTFTSLDGLQDILGIGGDLIIELSSVSSLSGLSNLLSIGGNLRIRSQLSGSFSSFAGLSSLTSLGGLVIDNSDFINSLSGMTNLVSLGSISLERADVLTNLTGLPTGLDMIKELRFSGNDILQTLEGLGAIDGVLNLHVVNNPNLTSISALAGSSFSGNDAYPAFDVKTPRLSIEGNPILISLNGVPSITPLGEFEDLVIVDNPLITSLSVLDGLVGIWTNAGFVGNVALSDCSTLATVMDAVDDGFPGPNEYTSDPTVDPPDLPPRFAEGALGNNAPGCNTMAEILGSSSEEGVFMDGFETTIP